MTCTRLRVPVETEFVPTVRAYVSTTARVYQMDSEASDHFGQAGAELVELLVKSAHEPGDGASIEVSLEPVAAGLELTVHDKGLPLDEEQWRDSLSELIGRHALDQLRIVNLGTHGNQTRLTKFFEGVKLNRTPPSIELKREGSEPVHIRRLQAGDGGQVSRCVYYCYGYSYGASESVYFPERLEAVNAEGKTISMVAVTENGKVVGHLGFDRAHAGAKLGTVGVLAVLPTFRSQGVGARLAEALIAEARKGEMAGLEAYAVTSNLTSQKLLEQSGFKVQSFILGTPYEGLERRECLVGAHLALQPSPDDGVVYAPTRHRAMIEVLCNEVGRRPRFESPDRAELPQEKSRLGGYQSPLRNVARIFVDFYGCDILEQVRANLRQLRLQNVRQLTMILPLGDPATAALVPKFEKMGFFFAGIQVRERAGLSLVLQYLHGVTVDYDKLVFATEMARELASYVRCLDRQQR